MRAKTVRHNLLHVPPYVRDICRREIAAVPLFMRIISTSSSFKRPKEFFIKSFLQILASLNIILLSSAFNLPVSEIILT